jgi:FkbM family methyltransferase
MLLKRIIQRTGLYEYFKYSLLFRVYERIFKPRVIAAHKKEVRLYRRILGHAGTIFDIGAYDGHKTAAFLEIGERVVACEPDARNFELLRIRFRNKKSRVMLHRTALADRTGNALFFIHHEGSAFNTLNAKWKGLLEGDGRKRWQEEIRFQPGKEVEVSTTTLDELIGLYGMPEFIKIDVEGYEKHVFMGLTQKVPCISFECLLPEFEDDMLTILEKLISFDDRTVFNVVFEEELLFEEFISYPRILEWVKSTELYCFDLVARTIKKPA